GRKRYFLQQQLRRDRTCLPELQQELVFEDALRDRIGYRADGHVKLELPDLLRTVGDDAAGDLVTELHFIAVHFEDELQRLAVFQLEPLEIGLEDVRNIDGRLQYLLLVKCSGRTRLGCDAAGCFADAADPLQEVDHEREEFQEARRHLGRLDGVQDVRQRTPLVG